MVASVPAQTTSNTASILGLVLGLSVSFMVPACTTDDDSEIVDTESSAGSSGTSATDTATSTSGGTGGTTGTSGTSGTSDSSDATSTTGDTEGTTQTGGTQGGTDGTGAVDTGPTGDQFGCDAACDCGPQEFCVQYTEGCGTPNCEGGTCYRVCVSYPTCELDDRCGCLSQDVCPSFADCQDNEDNLVNCDVPVG